jgi:nitroreductase/NAD-dependent dihydropyrimidine dehydrogenase PreA subunit
VIVVDEEKCTACGSCVEICHEHCITLDDGSIQIDEEVCSTCTQCVAICPVQALSWGGVESAAFDGARLPSPEQLDELFKERRSIRTFREEKIDRTLLQEIVNYGVYAPTHNPDLRAVVVDDEGLIELCDQAVLRFVSRIYTLVYKPRIIAALAGLIGLSGEYLKAKPKMEAVLDRGRALRSPPAAIVFIVGDKRVPLSELSAQCELCNIFFYAQAKGIGSCLWANGPMFVDRNREVRRRLGLQPREHILGALLMGYPAVRFRNKVEGKRLPIQWNDR